MDAAVYRATFDRLLSDDPHEFHARVAERDGRLIGLVHYLFHRNCWRVEDVVYLQDLHVAPEARGSGVGRALIEAVYAEADAAGCPTIYWLTQDFNAPARRLCDRRHPCHPVIQPSRQPNAPTASPHPDTTRIKLNQLQSSDLTRISI